ncbi:putative hydrolase of the HAD superfamily [Jatrophihabitans endophyticus]|uniref:Putative hydrolase of the HAD superfamily n=1 Tax=Jatrophihabitans endophyticus TaxID=1206085 RepID=A0A1M5KWL5_9ACTN|nr:putative hydrolase of the HAD superfamily [Jatrophihabitans endophyticus]
MLFDFSGTLFFIESADEALRAALGPEFVGWAPRLRDLGAINGSTEPRETPPHLAELWERRDLSAEAHRAAYSGLSRHAGLSEEQAAALYDRGVLPAAWRPYPDTVRVLRRLRELRIPTALVSNIGWDPRPVLAAHGVADCLDVLVLSDEQGVVKPDPEIFRRACAALAADPTDCVMVGDSVRADQGCEALGIRFALVSSVAAEREPDALLHAVGIS